ncbi:MAG TPA: hypothetical protein VGR71_09685 [Nitrospira sp.]|nr:hypothetical protein [Nitrospira sp.]
MRSRYPEDSRSGEIEEHRRGWKRCGCPVHVEGSLGGGFKRQSTGRWEWDAAKEVVALWESAGIWAIPDDMPLPKSIEAPERPSDRSLKSIGAAKLDTEEKKRG